MSFKGIVSVILSDPPCKDCNVLFTTVPLKPLFDQNVEDTADFQTRSVSFFIGIHVTFAEKPQNAMKKTIVFKNEQKYKQFKIVQTNIFFLLNERSLEESYY